MIRVTPPASDSAGLWTDDHNLDPPSPLYSPVAISPESVLTPESLPDSGSPHSDDLLWSSNASFVYESSLVDVSLGRRVWGLRQPVYGFNGIVQGAIKLSRNCTHVVRVEVSVKRALLYIAMRGIAHPHVLFCSSWEESR